MKKISDFLLIYLKKILSSISLILAVTLVILALSISLYSKKKQLIERTHSLSKVLSGLAYDTNFDLISRVGRLHSSFDGFHSLEIKLKHNERVIYKINGSDDFSPFICELGDDSEVISVKLCEKILSKSQLFMLISMITIIFVSFYLLLQIFSSKLSKLFNEVSDEIINLIDGDSKNASTFSDTFEVLKIKSLIIKNKELIQQDSIDRTALELSRRVVHDLRSPTMILRKEFVNPNKTSTIALDALKTIDNICDDLLSQTRKDVTSCKRLNRERIKLEEFINRILAEKKSELGYNFFKYNGTNPSISLWINRLEFKRCISNIINNSYESINNIKNGKIIIDSFFNENNFIVEIRDNGSGFSESFIAKFNNREPYSNKINGNAIGIASAVEFIEKYGGELKCFNNNGAVVQFVFQKQSIIFSNDPIILLEDDKYVSYTWINSASKCQIPLKWFKSWADLKNNLEVIPLNSEFFIDSSLNDEMAGEDISKELFELGFFRLNICSNFPEEKFNKYTFLNSIIKKEFPYFNNI